jgi:multidrug efflux system membrane fusion protein
LITPKAPFMSEVIVRQRSGIGAWVIVLAVLAAIVALILWHPWGSGRRAPRAMPPSPVGIAAAGTSDMPIIDAGLGTVTPLATVTVQSQIAGIMQTIGFTEGQLVHRGDFLAQIDPRPYQALLDQARGTLAHDQGLLAQAQNDLKRYATLNRQDSISRQQVDDQRFLVQQYQGSVAADQGAVQTQMVNLAFCHIVSPVDGRVGLRQVDAGNYVTTALTNGIVVVTQLQPISVIFTVPEDAITAIQKRLAAGAKLSVAAWDRSDTTLLATGTLETIDNQIDTTTGTVRLRAIFDNASGLLFPNQFVNARLLVDTVRGAVTIPNAGLQSGAPGNFVYLLNADDTVSVRPVKVGIADSNLTQITSGLNVGDKIVIDGADRLRDGMHVMVPRAGPPGAATPGAAPVHHRHKPASGE